MAVGAVILARTKFGSDVYATGGNLARLMHNARLEGLADVA